MLALNTERSPHLVAQLLATFPASSSMLISDAEYSANTKPSVLLSSALPVITSVALFLLVPLSEMALPLLPHFAPIWLIFVGS